MTYYYPPGQIQHTTVSNNTNSVIYNPNGLAGLTLNPSGRITFTLAPENPPLTVAYTNLTARWSFNNTNWKYLNIDSKPELFGYIKCLVDTFVLNTDRSVKIEYVYETDENKEFSYNALFLTDQTVQKYCFNKDNWSDDLLMV